jgi:hypothetical protein
MEVLDEGIVVLPPAVQRAEAQSLNSTRPSQSNRADRITQRKIAKVTAEVETRKPASRVVSDN